MNDTPVIRSPLETDLYKFTMWQTLLHAFPANDAEYRFVCRNTPAFPLSELCEAVNRELDHLCTLGFSDEELAYLGGLRLAVVCAATLMTAAAVAISGIIGWVGLLIPHAARMLVGPEFSRLLPLSMALGAAFLLAVDTLARTIAPIEVPPGVLTALIGTPFFLWLFASARRAWQ